MLHFTPQERAAIIFITCALCAGSLIAVVSSYLPGRELASIAEHSVKLDLNRVSCDELARSGIVPGKLAGKIIASRVRLGRFSTMEELLEVKGIGPARLRRLKDVCYVGKE